MFCQYRPPCFQGFSPVAGIQWVETQRGRGSLSRVSCHVSVPLPGFSGLRHVLTRPPRKKRSFRFSPVAGIQWVETHRLSFCQFQRLACFSPVAGIQWVETLMIALLILNGSNVSVPLPGFSGLRLADATNSSGS